MKIKLSLSLISLFVFSLFTASPALAVYVQTGDNVILNQKRYDESVFVAGNNVDVKSDINGDLFCAGKSITISGKVTGDILCAGQIITSNGDIDGNLRAVGQTIFADGKIGKNISVAGQTFTLGEKGSVKNDAFFAGQTINLSGYLGRDLTGASQALNLGNVTNRNAILAFRTLNVSSAGSIKGNLDYYFEKGYEPQFSTDSVKGTINKHEVVPPAKSDINDEKLAAAKQSAATFGKIFWFVSNFLFALVVLLLFGHSVKTVSSQISSKFWSSFGIGFAVLILTPIVCLILSFTLIGFPIAVAATLIYILGIMASMVFVGSALGEVTLVKYFKQKQLSVLAYTLLGVIGILLLSKIPVIGCLVGLATITTGLGAFTRSLFRKA